MFRQFLCRRATLCCCLFFMLVFPMLSACSDGKSAGSVLQEARPSISILAPLHFPQQPSKRLWLRLKD